MDTILEWLRRLLAWLPIERLREPPPVVAVLRLAGPIGQIGVGRAGLTLTRLAPAIERAFSLPRVGAVALAINSPGGSAVQSALIAKRIRDLAAEKHVPVVAFAEDVAASGGYWLACAADEIYADANSIVGSIGVVFSGFGFVDLIRRIGVRRRLYTAGERKAPLDPFEPENPEEVERIKGIQREIHENFQSFVRERRGDRLQGLDSDLFSGEFWTGRRALELGLIDGLDDLRGAMRRRFGDNVRFRRVNGESMSLLRFFRPRSAGTGEWVDEALAAVETRALWGRFGF